MSILHLRDLIPSAQCDAVLPDGRWVKAIHEPPPTNVVKAAWAVLTGRAYAVAWPFHGEFEQAMVASGYEVPK